MRSLRFRLTVAYAAPTALALCIAFGALTYLALQFLTRPVVQALATSAARTRALVNADTDAPEQTLFERIEREAAIPGVRIITPHRPVAPAWLRTGSSPGPGFSLDAPVSAGPPPDERMGVIARTSVGGLRLASLMALRPEVVRVRGAAVLIVPDLQAIGQTANAYLEGFGASIVFSLIASWLIARWITAQAIAPLTTVTNELERFSIGDFTPRPVTTTDRTELGALIRAYNGAAAQVARAFRERERVELHMRRFVADAGHELRTPLTAISGFLEILEHGGAEKSAVRDRAFETMKKETRRMYGLVERLIALSRLESLENVAPVDVDLRELVTDSIVAVTAARRGTLLLRRSDDARVFADPAVLHDAIGNLIDNALKYGAGSDVVVDIARDDPDVVIRVADRGPGIPEHERSLIFDRFFRGDGRSGIDGSGLGLSIAARAAELAGGALRLETADPGNTVFVLRLPQAR